MVISRRQFQWPDSEVLTVACYRLNLPNAELKGPAPSVLPVPPAKRNGGEPEPLVNYPPSHWL
jgi:hypothetical protein